MTMLREWMADLGIGRSAVADPDPEPEPAVEPEPKAQSELAKRLPRAEVAEGPSMAPLDADLAQKAARLLGYRTGTTAIKRAEDLVRAQGVLRKLGIRPFVREAVEKYKTEERDRRQRRASDEAGAYSLTRKHYHWVSLPLDTGDYDERYAAPIPEFVLQTAVRIKEEVPSANFRVDALQERTIPVGDPFLIVQLYGHDFYVEVWDEPNFKEEREA